MYLKFSPIHYNIQNLEASALAGFYFLKTSIGNPVDPAGGCGYLVCAKTCKFLVSSEIEGELLSNT